MAVKNVIILPIITTVDLLNLKPITLRDNEFE